ncbi:S-adenosyl-L-methionine-dependent methyltransferases superfamily protein [Wolffia australiana]
MATLLFRSWQSLKSPTSLRLGGRRLSHHGTCPLPSRCSYPAACSSSSSPAAIGLEAETLLGFISGKMKATEVAHLVWKSILQKGDCAIDATCGNGHDSLALLRMIADDSGHGFVYAFDIQNSAIESTRSLLEESTDLDLKNYINLSLLCHSKIEDVVPKDAVIRLMAFNLGYLPGGDKGIITIAETTLPALQAASRVVASGGLISILVYVGHPGGRDELEAVQTFASNLPTESWSCCKLERLNRPAAPILVLLFKK